jgi:hypothetical protein
MATHVGNEPAGFTAFGAGRRLVQGELPEVVTKAKEMLERASLEQVLIFDDRTGEQIDVDLHGPLEVILKHLPGFEASQAKAGDSPAPRPGRPKLGVVPREVTLLPRHWEWLNGQPGGASTTLRKLVDEARRSSTAENQGRKAQEACYRFMVAAAGNLPNFENATRALFAGDVEAYGKATSDWPEDLRGYAAALLAK